MARFLCTGDLHLDAMPDLGRTPGERLAEQEAVWKSVLALAIEHDVDAVLFAGDAFEHRRPTPQAMLAFERPLVEISDRYVPNDWVYAIVGNHDRSGVAEGTGLEVFAEAGLLTLASEPQIHDVAGVSICCLPWAPVSRIVAAAGGGDRDDVNAYAAELLVATARGLRERVDGPAILLTHFSVSGSSLPSGLPVDQLREPVLELGELDALGFDAIVCGHVHEAQVFGRERTPAFYVGSPLPLNFGEADSEHGCFLLEPDPASANERERAVLVPRFIPLESRGLIKLGFNLSTDLATEPPYEIAEASVMDAVVKVTVYGTAEEARHFDVAAFKRALYDAGAEKVYAVNLEVERTERARVEGLDEELDELAALELWLDSQGLNGDQAAALRERTEAYLGRVRA